MKQKLFIYLATFLPLLSFAQGATLTKDETVNYINKKLAEVKEQWYNDGYININELEILKDGYLKHSDKLATAKGDCSYYNNTDYKGKLTSVTFKAGYIKKVDTVKSYSPTIGVLKIDFIPNTVKWNITAYSKNVKPIYRKKFSHNDFWGNAVYYDEYVKDQINCYSNEVAPAANSNSVYIYFLKADPTNYSRLMKAFNHLIALYKAEDDPFGE